MRQEGQGRSSCEKNKGYARRRQDKMRTLVIKIRDCRVIQVVESQGRVLGFMSRTLVEF